MKIAITYPPLKSEKGIPLLGQNRQFQWFNDATYIYPMVPAYAATYLKTLGFDVTFNDAIAMNWNWDTYEEFYKKQSFDLVMIESKTPVIKMHWDIINKLKALSPNTIIVLVGDHVTAYPKESMLNSKVDYVLTGGDYDFLLANLCQNIRDGFDASKLEPGIWYRFKDEINTTGVFLNNHDLNTLPMIDRDLTNWQLYSQKNGNYLKLPGTYTMTARDCWHHKCTFCSWTKLYPNYRVRKPELLLDEIGILIEKYGVKEIMDDSGAFPIGEWLHTFCNGMIKRGYNTKVNIDCNMRLDNVSYEDFVLMKKAGFRFVLFGVESANQETLDRIHKNEKIEDMIESCKNAKKAGLSPHITLMFGYPWENEKMINNSIELARQLLIKNYAHSLQATILIPYPGTPLFEECKQNNWLLTDNYDDFDQRMIVAKTLVEPEKINEAILKVYKVSFNPEFIWHRLTSIRSLDDIKFIVKAVKKVFGHLLDFSKK